MVRHPSPERGDGSGRKQSCLRELGRGRRLFYVFLRRSPNWFMEADRDRVVWAVVLVVVERS